MNENEEERYVATPKGIALLAMLQCGLIQSIDDPRVDGFWCVFEQRMIRAGYTVPDEDGET